MTERLTMLLRDEAQALDIPTPKASAVLSDGRGMRVRRRLGTGVAIAGVVAVTGVGSLVVADRMDSAGPGRGEVASPPSYGAQAVFSVGHDVRLGGANAPVATLAEDIHSLHYTSAGVVVRTNLNGGASDGSGPEHFTLVRPDGTTRAVDVTTEDMVVSTDLDQPYLAYSELADGGGVQVVLRNVATDEEAARIDVAGDYEPTGWPSPPVWLDGDTVYVGFEDTTLAVDWRTGESREAEHLGGGMPLVLGGRATAYEQVEEPGRDGTGGRGLATVFDADTGETLLSAEVTGYGGFSLSPDGRYALLEQESDDPERPWEPAGSFDVFDVDTGAKVTIDRTAVAFGWTPGGDLFRLEDDKLVTCDSATGACSVQPSGVDPDDVLAPGEPMPGDVTVCDENGKCVEEEPDGPQPLPVKLGGRLYES